MRYRTLYNDRKVAEAPNIVPMTIASKCPRKWAFVDMETGNIWVHKSRYPKSNRYTTTFRMADKATLIMISDIMGEYTRS